MQGEWTAKLIDNPDYQGEWVHPHIPNPDYEPDEFLYLYEDFGGIGFDLWQVQYIQYVCSLSIYERGVVYTATLYSSNLWWYFCIIRVENALSSTLDSVFVW